MNSESEPVDNEKKKDVASAQQPKANTETTANERRSANGNAPPPTPADGAAAASKAAKKQDGADKTAKQQDGVTKKPDDAAKNQNGPGKRQDGTKGANDRIEKQPTAAATAKLGSGNDLLELACSKLTPKVLALLLLPLILLPLLIMVTNACLSLSSVKESQDKLSGKMGSYDKTVNELGQVMKELQNNLGNVSASYETLKEDVYAVDSRMSDLRDADEEIRQSLSRSSLEHSDRDAARMLWQQDVQNNLAKLQKGDKEVAERLLTDRLEFSEKFTTLMQEKDGLKNDSIKLQRATEQLRLGESKLNVSVDELKHGLQLVGNDVRYVNATMISKEARFADYGLRLNESNARTERLAQATVTINSSLNNLLARQTLNTDAIESLTQRLSGAAEQSRNLVAITNSLNVSQSSLVTKLAELSSRLDQALEEVRTSKLRINSLEQSNRDQIRNLTNANADIASLKDHVRKLNESLLQRTPTTTREWRIRE